MTEKEKIKAAKIFAEYWQGRGDEKQETQAFWNALLRDVYGVERPEQYVSYELPVKLSHTSFIDGFISTTKVLIEQKSIDVDLTKSQKQSDGSMLTPYQQARRYAGYLPHNDNPRWIIVCNFKEFHIHDMNRPNDAPTIVLLENFHNDFHLLDMLTKEKDERLQREMEISVQAGTLVGKLYDAILKQYDDPEDKQTQHDLNVLCVRLVFCLYAEDAGLFDKHRMFRDYLKSFKPEDSAQALALLFDTLNTDKPDRKKYLSPALKEFPYVNGGLFEQEIEIPLFNDEIMDLLIHEGSEKLNWSQISPTIFGAIFESTLNPDTRRSGGMHYTSIENIHKVIDPLFLDDLKAELRQIKQLPDKRNKNNESRRTRRLETYRTKLSKLVFLDPAAGSGNFLTETYVCLRRLENEALREISDQLTMHDDIIKVHINQFYGIEINDFAVSVAMAALWIAESQMFNETLDIVPVNIDFLPLKTNANIVEGNRLHMEWEEVVSKNKLSYIMGNPPFVGQTKKTKEQSYDMAVIFGSGSPETKLDYVICWYKKAIKYIRGTDITVAFVSTNSICQGESVPTFWKNLVSDGAEIQFAYDHFKWTSESTRTAAVYCVIIGFSNKKNNKKKLYKGNVVREYEHINAYLLPAPDLWLESRGKNKIGMPKLQKGSEPADGGNLFLTSQEKDFLEAKYPVLSKYIKPFIGADEFLKIKNGEFKRYCFWFKDSYNPADIKGIKEIQNRLEKIKEKRSQSSADRIRKMADQPYLFSQIRQPKTTYIVIPETTTSSRKYIPMGFYEKDIIAGNSTLIAPEMTLFHFGVLISNVHMAWTKVVCGRMGMGYRYSPAIYNNFPWCNVTPEEKSKIEKTAQAILDARAKYPDSSLADLYDEITMPPELRTAHQKNDMAVMEAYGFFSNDKTRDSKWFSENETVIELMKMHQELTTK